MKTILTFIIIFAAPLFTHAQDSTFNVYNPLGDGMAELNKAVAEAKSSGKHVLVEVGGNWCKWCRLFYKWSHENKTVDSLITADYVVVHSNYSKENKNPELMKRFKYPQRFGFPVFLILDGNGNRLHTQNTGYLEEENGYSEKKVVEFLKQWNFSALKPENY